MARDEEIFVKVSSPRIFLFRMLVFLVLAALLAVLLHRQIWYAFLANPALNGVILGTLAVGILMSIRQVIRLFPEVRWVNNFRRGDPGLAVNRPPVLLAPMATLLGGERKGRMAISQQMMRGILDSIGTRLDESREIARYLTGLLVFLGLLGTFWGLLETIGAIGNVISSLEVGGDSGRVFEDLKSGLAAPLSGMGIAFSSSLFGLAGSLILGFLDLQAGQAQSRFYTELEDWLARATTDPGGTELAPRHGPSPDLILALNKLTTAVNEGAGGRAATQAMANLAEGIQGLVQHMRAEQQMIRDWVEAQAAREKELKQVLERLSRERIS
jgi:hypothetical protein